MTITLGWWAIPLLISLLAFATAQILIIRHPD